MANGDGKGRTSSVARNLSKNIPNAVRTGHKAYDKILEQKLRAENGLPQKNEIKSAAERNQNSGERSK